MDDWMMVRTSFMGASPLRISNINRTTFSKTKAQKKTVGSPKMYEPLRPQTHSSCWCRLFHSLTHMHGCAGTHTHVAGTPLPSSLEIHRCSHSHSWKPTHPPCSQATSPADDQSALAFTGVSF